MINIRAAGIPDAEEIADLLHQLGYARSAADIARHIATLDEKAVILVAVRENGQAVGCLQAQVDSRLAEGLRGEIVSLVVAAEARSRGIGAELLTAAAQWLQERGIGRMRVRCNAARDRAHHFYERLGFQLTKTQKVYDIPVEAVRRPTALA
jgi:ribosomal protein S18 acetylase RimI-like enzyme